jgi:protein SCO1
VVGRSATARRLAMLGLGAGLLAGIWIATSPTATAQRPAPGAGDPGFHLVDAAGSPYALESFPPDAVVVIYFGYTTCLRACPTTLNDIAEALDSLGSDGALVTPIFIDMDPDRAALVSLPLYMQSFGPRFLGLTGTPNAVAKAAKAFDVQLERLQFSSDPSDYAMLHASPIFVMRGGDHRPVSLSAASPPAAVAAAIRNALARPPVS